MAEAKRRLAAIVYADVAGYSRLMADDDRATLAALNDIRATMARHVEAHEGRVVNAPGDSLLAEFASAVEAVHAAADVQAALVTWNAALPEDRRMRLRIGVTLGDVLVESDGTLYGDGVNIAARLEGLAEPGGICVSAKVVEEVAGKTALGFQTMGEHAVKNIARAIHAYSVVAESSAPTAHDGPLALPDKPSIAVLPFDNLSGAAEQEYFADGIAEDLITALSCIRWLFVIARNSTFAYKGQSPDIRRVGRELGVRYVLEGSVRKGGNRVRVSAQLIDTGNGAHVWAERYDRELGDTFALQDELTLAIAGAIEPEIGMAERERVMRKPPENLDAWEWYQRGLWHFHQFSRERNREAQTMLRRAIESDGTFAPAHAALSYAYLVEASLGFGDNFEDSMARALAAAEAAVALDDKDYFAHTMLGRVYVVSGKEAAAIEELNIAIRLNPSFALAHYGLGQAHIGTNNPAEAIREIDTAERLSPHDPFAWLFDVNRSLACFMSGDYVAALGYGERACRGQGKDAFWPYAEIAAAQAHLGVPAEAARALEAAREREPRLTIAFAKDTLPYRYQDHFGTFIDGLREAGLPEA